MRPGKKFPGRFLPTLLCLVVMLIAACGGGPTSPTTGEHAKAPQNRQVLVSGAEAGTSDIKTLDPGLSTDAFSIDAIDNVFTGLVQLDDHLNVVDQLAQSHQIMPDGVTYKFTLRSGLKFSDGTALTSQDVVYSINRALDQPPSHRQVPII